NEPAPQIDEGVLNQGVILVYAKLDGYNERSWPHGNVGLLPISLNYFSGGIYYIDTWSAKCTVGNIRIDMTNSKNLYTSIATSHSYRYVIIPGGASSELREDIQLKPGIIVNKSELKDLSYEEVCHFFEIKE